MENRVGTDVDMSVQLTEACSSICQLLELSDALHPRLVLIKGKNAGLLTNDEWLRLDCYAAQAFSCNF